MRKSERNSVCPVERAGLIDNPFRKLLHNPRKILKPYINNTMTVLEVGCGSGFFTIEIAKLLTQGRVIAVDLQQGMLDKLQQKIRDTELKQKILLHKCDQDKIGLDIKVDLVLAFFMVHEVPDPKSFFVELKSILNSNGKVFVIEPISHVSKKIFSEMIHMAKTLGFEVVSKPKVFLGRAVLLKIKEKNSHE
ncbi:MAG: methyltransferase domain-containing protein [Bacteroidales bacterium]|nr:methyltransferase domain-containing protein [Bacteroidales bacterium]